MRKRLCLWGLLGLVLIAWGATAAAETRVSQPDVVLFSQPFCPSCESAKHYFASHGIAYREYDISESDKAREIFERLGGRGTPLLVVGSKVLQGFSPERFEQLRQQQALGEEP